MIAVDTNVLVYSCEKSDPVRQSIALELIDSAREGVLLWQVACEFIAASRKLAPQGFTAEQAWQRLAEFSGVLTLTRPSAAVLEQARILHTQKHWSFWDALIVGACQEAGVRRLYSEDIPGSSPPAGLEIINPFPRRA